ncbi:MAG: hypothetical protein L3J11_08740, partial [Draconibacterium sp.]|nr:hypothetical protein [Draconibacterium sp.]
MKVQKTIFILFFYFFFLNVNAQQKDEAYLFAYFIGNGEDGLHLAYSEDGLKWEALNNNEPFLNP